MSSTSDLEKELERSERKRLMIERRLNPDALNESLKAIEEFKSLYADLLEAKAFQRVSSLLEMQTTFEGLSIDLDALRNKVGQVTENMDGLERTLQTIIDRLASLEHRFDEEERQNRTLRERELQTLKKIDDYLANWA